MNYLVGAAVSFCICFVISAHLSPKLAILIGIPLATIAGYLTITLLGG